MAVTPPYANLVLNETQEDTFLAAATIPQYARVTLNSSGAIIVAANATDLAFGVAKQPIANGSYGVVRLDLPQQYGLANTLINVGDTVYQAATGYVSATLVNNAIIGVAKIGAPVPNANTSNNQAAVVILAVRKSAI